MTVTFFGHRDAPDTLYLKLRSVLIDLIENKGANSFYVCDSGSFDMLVHRALVELKQKYDHISCTTVLAYMPRESSAGKSCIEDSIFPESVACTFPRYAICARNKWMLEQSDYGITYVKRGYGGAARFKKMAMCKGKSVIEL